MPAQPVVIYVQDSNVKASVSRHGHHARRVKAGASGYVDHVGKVRLEVSGGGDLHGTNVDGMAANLDGMGSILCLCVGPKTAFPGLYRDLARPEYDVTLTFNTLITAFPGLLGRFRILPGINLTAPCHIIDNEGALRMRSVPHKY